MFFTDADLLMWMLLKFSYLELPLLITAAQRYERHFEGLPHRIQVVFNHLLEWEHITYEAKLQKKRFKLKSLYKEVTSVLCTSCSVSSSLIRYISKNGSDLLKRSCIVNRISKLLNLKGNTGPCNNSSI